MTHPIRITVMKNNPSLSSALTFSVEDAAGNKGQPNASITSLSFLKKGQTRSERFPSVEKEQGQVSFLANGDGLRNVQIVANGGTVPVGDIAPGRVKTVDLRSRLNPGSDNAVSITAEGDAGVTAQTLVSSAVLADASMPTGERHLSRGDMNEDGGIDVGDAVALLHYAAGLRQPDSIEKALGDVNLDGRLDVADAVALLKEIARR
jgi:hypothetical protein